MAGPGGPRRPAAAAGRLPVEVVIPLRWDGPVNAAAVEELAHYLCWLALRADVTVVDGSEPWARQAHMRAWGGCARVLSLPTTSDARPLNGKVMGAMAGITAARHDRVVLADDDVRYDDEALVRVVELLEGADLVRPSNVYSDWPWQARWDMARSLLNHALGQDWPGTFGLRAKPVLAMGGWDPTVLFENLELVRAVRRHGGQVRDAPEVRVLRTPPTVSQFWAQRVRQAYDDWAQPLRLCAELGILPITAITVWRAPWLTALLAAGLVALAMWGRRKHRRVPCPADVPWWAPVWALERGICVWIAVWARCRGGMRYRGIRFPRAAQRRTEVGASTPLAGFRGSGRRSR